MSKIGKFAVGIAAFLIMAGGLLALAGGVMGAETSYEYERNGMILHVSPFGVWNEWSETAEPAGTVGDYSGGARDMSAFSDIEINLDLGDVRFEAAEDYGVDLRWSNDAYRLYYENEGGTLRVWSESWHDLPSMKRDIAVIVYFPAGTVLQTVDVRTALGDLTLSSFSAKNLTVENNLGTVDLDTISAADLYADLDLGNLTGKNLEVTRTTSVQSSLGNVNLDGKFHDTDVACDMGDVTIATSLPKSEYSYDLSCDMGDIQLDGTTANDDHTTRDGGVNMLTVSTSMGTVDISFGV